MVFTFWQIIMSRKDVPFRFGVKDKNGKCSSIYRIWKRRKEGDSNIYFAVRSMAGLLKISFHESGECISAFTRQYKDKLKTEGKWQQETRILDRWEKTKEYTPRVIVGLRIVIPSRFLIKSSNEKDINDVSWVEARPGDSITEFIVTFLRKGKEKAKLPGTPLASLELPNQENVFVSFMQYEMETNIKNLINKHCFQINVDESLTSDYRGLIFGEDSRGFRVVMERSLEK